MLAKECLCPPGNAFQIRVCRPVQRLARRPPLQQALMYQIDLISSASSATSMRSHLHTQQCSRRSYHPACGSAFAVALLCATGARTSYSRCVRYRFCASGCIWNRKRMCRRCGTWGERSFSTWGGREVSRTCLGAQSGASASRTTASRTSVSKGLTVSLKWERIDEGAFLLRGDTKSPRAVFLFTGGALVGAAPQLTYGRFLKMLAARGYWVLAAAYAAGLDYVAVSDLVELRFERALNRLGLNVANGPPLIGLGHSLGALSQVLQASRHSNGLPRHSQILVAYTRKGEEALPLVRTALAANPLLGSLLRAVDVKAAAGMIARGSEIARQLFPVGGPSPLQIAPPDDFLPLLEQMVPLLREVGLERDDFRPGEERLRMLLEEGYRVRRTLLVRLTDDEALDETSWLVSQLAALPTDRQVEFTVRISPGQHLLPLLPDLPDSAGSTLADSVASLPVLRPPRNRSARTGAVGGSGKSSSRYGEKDASGIRWDTANDQLRELIDVVDNFAKEAIEPKAGSREES